ncbi:hypothetical protein V1515DRAFT_271933 [Lipomyces mesembrius]
MMRKVSLRLSCRLVPPTVHNPPHVRAVVSWSGRGRQSSSKPKKSAPGIAKAVVEVDGVPWWAYDEYEHAGSVPRDKAKMVLVDSDGNVTKALKDPRDGRWDRRDFENSITPKEEIQLRAGKRMEKKFEHTRTQRAEQTESTNRTDPNRVGSRTRKSAQDATSTTSDRILPGNDLSSKKVDSRRLTREGLRRDLRYSNMTQHSIEDSVSSDNADNRHPAKERPADMIQRLMEKRHGLQSHKNNSEPRKVVQTYYNEENDDDGYPQSRTRRQDNGLSQPTIKELPIDNMFAKLTAARQTANKLQITERVRRGGFSTEQRFEHLKSARRSLPSSSDVPPAERWRLKVAKKKLRRQDMEQDLLTGFDQQPEPQPLKSRPNNKRERNPNKPFGKVAHAKLDLKKIGRLDENGNINFIIYPWKPMLQSHRTRVHHAKFPGFEHNVALQPRLFYERVITWPYLIEREWLTGQQTVYRYEARLRPLFFSDWNIPEMWFQGHGKNQKDADQTAFIRMLSKLHQNFDPNTKLDDFLPGRKYGIPYDPEVPIVKDKEMPHMVGRNIWLMQPLATQLKFLEKVEFETQRLSDIGKLDEINAWNQFVQLNLVDAVNHIRKEVNVQTLDQPVNNKYAKLVEEFESTRAKFYNNIAAADVDSSEGEETSGHSGAGR